MNKRWRELADTAHSRIAFGNGDSVEEVSYIEQAIQTAVIEERERMVVVMRSEAERLEKMRSIVNQKTTELMAIIDVLQAHDLLSTHAKVGVEDE